MLVDEVGLPDRFPVLVPGNTDDRREENLDRAFEDGRAALECGLLEDRPAERRNLVVESAINLRDAVRIEHGTREDATLLVAMDFRELLHESCVRGRHFGSG